MSDLELAVGAAFLATMVVGLWWANRLSAQLEKEETPEQKAEYDALEQCW